LSVPFIAIAQEVAAAVQADSTQRLNGQSQVFGAVRWLTSGELDEEQVFARLARLAGLRLFICTVLGTPLLPGVPVPPPELRRLLPSSSDAPPTYRVVSCCRSPLLADRPDSSDLSRSYLSATKSQYVKKAFQDICPVICLPTAARKSSDQIARVSQYSG
jgi:hypothetical protein